MSGFFLMHRGWRDNPIFRGEFSRADAWVWLIENAAWKSARTRIKGDTIELERGELSFSVRFLADAWGWSKSRVDRFLADLRDEGMIETRSKIGTGDAHKAGQGQSIITICNYCKYQDQDAGERDNSGTTSGTTAGQQRDKEEQGNKGTRVEEEPNGSSPTIPAHGQKPPKAKAEAKSPMTADWSPGPLPDTIAALTAQWPPGRLEQVVDDVRDYWLDHPSEKRPGWDRTLHRRIREIHPRVMRDLENANRNRQADGGAASGYRGPDRRDGFTRAIDRAGGFDQPGGLAGAAGRPDAGDGSDHRQLAAAPGRTLLD